MSHSHESANSRWRLLPSSAARNVPSAVSLLGLGRLAILLAAFAAVDISVARAQEDASEGVEFSEEDEDLASVPDMYGDFFARSRFVFDSDNISSVGSANFPQRGRVKVGENNSVIPQDRFYFMYQRFGNAVESTLRPSPNGALRSQSQTLNRYILGVEKTWLGGSWSTEVRVPLLDGSDTIYGTDVFARNGNAGNLSIIIKHLISKSQDRAVSAGLGISLPSGSDTEFDLGTERFTIENRAVHLQPFVGYVRANQRFFFQGFLQLDIATDGDPVTARLAGFAPQDLGILRDQTYLFADISGGFWVYRNPSALAFTGLAAIAEFHYGGSVSGANTVRGLTSSNTAYTIQPSKTSLHATTITTGLHAQVTESTSLRIAGVFPLVDELTRSFDSELWASINCRF